MAVTTAPAATYDLGMKNRWSDLRESATSQGWALLPLRLLVGFGFVAHGYAKLGRGPAHFAEILQGLGLPAPSALAWATTLVEFIGGLALMAGASVLPLCLPLAAVMTTAMLAVHLRYGFSSIRLKAFTPTGAEFGPVGYELNLLYLAGLFALAVSRPTPLSIDRWWKQRHASRPPAAQLRAQR